MARAQARARTADIDREWVRRRGLHEFVKRAWHLIVPEKFKDNWHIRLMCRYLERLFRGEIRKLCIMVPPGCSKSLICQVFFPTWCWTEKGREKFIYTTFEANLCKDFAKMQRDLVQSAWFQARWPEVTIPYQNTKSAALFRNNQMGFRASCGTGGAVTGKHAGILAGDDLLKAQDAMGSAASSMTEINKAWNFWSKTLVTRESDSGSTRRLLIMQCLHYDDPANRWIRSDPSVVVLCLPMEYDPEHPYLCPEDPRTEPGELLWPEHKSREAVEDLKRSLGPLDAAAQLQQNPGRTGGEVFELAWMGNYFKHIHSPKFERGLISCDLTFGSKSDSASYVALGAWARMGSKAYKVDAVRRRMSYKDTKVALRAFAAKHPWASEVIIENKANGPAVIDDLKGIVPGMIPNEPCGNKLARALSTTGYWEAGDVLLPNPEGAMLDGEPLDVSWVPDFVLEMNRFTGAPADVADQVDETSQALSRLYKGKASRFLAAMEAVAGGVMI